MVDSLPKLCDDHRFSPRSHRHGTNWMTEPESGDSWVMRLRSTDSAQRNAAIGELRMILERTLGRTFSHRYGSRVAVDDIIQDALLKILDSLNGFSGRSRFLTWATTIATRIGLTELRRRRYQDVSLNLDGEHDRLPTLISSNSISDGGESHDRIVEKLHELIESALTDRQRVAIRASLEDVPIEEISVRLGSNRNAVYKLIHDARLRLREGLLNSGVSPEDLSVIASH